MLETNNDAKTAAESSTVATTDVKPASSTENPAQSKGPLSAIELALKVAGDSTTPKETESDVQKVDTTAADDTAEEVQEDEPSKVEEATEEQKSVEDATKPPPFHEHPRWKEMVAERDGLKGEIESQRPLVEAQKAVVDYCTEHGITQDQYGQALEFLKAINTGDVSRARELMGPVWDALEGKSSGKLPADIQQRLDAGTIDAETAKELAQLRGANESRARMAETTRARQGAMAVETAVRNWAQAKGQSDPAYKPKTNGAPDGLFELVNAKAIQLGQTMRVTNAADTVRLLEQAYSDVKQSLARFVPKPPTAGKQLPTASASKTKPVYKNSTELAMAVVRGEVKPNF